MSAWTLVYMQGFSLSQSTCQACDRIAHHATRFELHTTVDPTIHLLQLHDHSLCAKEWVRGNGVVLNPILRETFTAIKGEGARLNGDPISCSKVSDIGRALIGTEIGVGRDEATVSAIMGRVRRCVEVSRSVRCSGSCAMNMVSVAMGRLDAFYEIGFGGPWDCVGAAVIVTEAGGVVLDPSGGEFVCDARRVLCGNASIGPALVDALRGIEDGPLEPRAPR